MKTCKQSESFIDQTKMLSEFSNITCKIQSSKCPLSSPPDVNACTCNKVMRFQ